MEQENGRDSSSGKLPELQVDPDKLASAKDAMRHLDKMVKTLEMFDARHENVARSKEAFREKIRKSTFFLQPSVTNTRRHFQL